MKSTLFFRFLFLLVAGILSVPAIIAQTWTFRNGFGQTGAVNSLADVGRSICTDASGNVYITGKISDDLTGNTVSFGGTPLVSAGDDDGFVAKFNSAGVHQWSIRFGGTSFTDIGYGIATDGTSVYVAGTVNGAMTVGTSPTSYPAAGTGIDGVIMKLSAATGAATWVTRFGGGNTDEAQSIAVDASGNVYVSGIFRTRIANPTATFGAFTRTVQGNTTSYTSDLFVAQLNSAGTFQWVSTGGIAGGNDNINGSGVCYVPGLAEVVVTGSFRWAATGTTTATYATTSPVSSVILTNSSATVNEDFCLLELSAGTGGFISGSSAGSADGNEAGLGITYDAFTSDVFFVGSFSSSSVTFPGSSANTNPTSTRDNIIYGRYNPSTNAYVWVKDADNGTSASAADVGRSITSNNAGRIFISGNFRNAITFPAGLSVTSAGLADIFVAGINATTGNADYITQGSGTNGAADDISYSIATGINGSVWITGQYASNLTLSPLTALASLNNEEDILLASYLDRPTITTPPAAASACTGLPVTFTVVASGSGLGYSWQEATNSIFTTGLVTLSNTGVYSGTNTATLTISDNTGLNGRYYRVIVSNTAGSVTSAGALLTVQTPTLSGNNTVTQNVNTSNNTYYAAACAVIAKVVPSGASPVTGSVTTQVWVEGAVPTYLSFPFVQRHYQVLPAVSPATATGTVTLYFTQAEFDNFNAAPGSTLNLPTGTADAAGKANLRIGRYPGSSNNASGLPGSYTTGTRTVIDPPDNQIVFNATFNRWEVTFDVPGFSGFIVQTSLFVLPVNLVSFTAQLVNNDVQLKWQTSSETETDHFEIERSLDGITFISIGQRAALNGSTIANYDLTDAVVSSLNKGKLFYRLKTKSIGGKEEFSKIIIVYIDRKGTLITGLLPNPFAHELNLGINAPRNGQMKLTITDMAGRTVLNQNIAITKGFSTQKVNKVDQLNSGVYTLTVNFDGLISTHKIVKQ